jgi:hypothetical protein
MTQLRPTLAFLALLGTGACFPTQPQKFGPAPAAADNKVVVSPRIPELRAYPCYAQCHSQLVPNPTPRDLEEFHHGKQLVHGGTLIWCTWCHTEGELDKLHLLDNTKISFDESYRLCGQCHGDKLRDWTNGIHGRQTGSWSGTKLRASCPVCHNPHRPKRPQFEALPPPVIGRDGERPGPTPVFSATVAVPIPMPPVHSNLPKLEKAEEKKHE